MNKKGVIPIILLFGMIFALGVLVLGAQNTTNNTNSTNINATINNINNINATLTTNNTNSTNINSTTNNNNNLTFENETNKTELDNESEIDSETETNKTELDNESEIDSETENEIQIMHTFQYGAKVRLLQLKRSLGIKIFEAQTVIDYMKNNSIGNTTKLELILSQLKALNESVSEISTTNKTQAIQSFVDIKLQAKKIINEFRIEAIKYLNENDKKSLRAIFVKIDKNKLKELKNKLRDEKRELLKEQTRKLLQRMGENNTALIQGIQNGTYSAEKARKILRKKYTAVKAVEKSKIRKKLEEQRKEIQKDKVKVLKEARENIQERLKEAKQKRIKKSRKYVGKTNGTHN